jgi:hypothetical protein
MLYRRSPAHFPFGQQKTAVRGGEACPSSGVARRPVVGPVGAVEDGAASPTVVQTSCQLVKIRNIKLFHPLTIKRRRGRQNPDYSCSCISCMQNVENLSSAALLGNANVTAQSRRLDAAHPSRPAREPTRSVTARMLPCLGGNPWAPQGCGVWIGNMPIEVRPTHRVSTVTVPGTRVAFAFVWGSSVQFSILIAIVAASVAAWASGLNWDVICIIIIIGCCIISLEDFVRSHRVDDG